MDRLIALQNVQERQVSNALELHYISFKVVTTKCRLGL